MRAFTLLLTVTAVFSAPAEKSLVQTPVVSIQGQPQHLTYAGQHINPAQLVSVQNGAQLTYTAGSPVHFAAAPAVQYAAAPAVQYAAAPAVQYAAAPAVQYAAAPAVQYAPTHAVQYAAAPVHHVATAVQYQHVELEPETVNVPVTRANVHVPIHQQVHYGTQQYVAGHTNQVYKPSLAAPAIQAPAVFKQKVTVDAPEVTVQHQDYPVVKNVPQYVDKPYFAGEVVQYTAPEVRDVAVATPYKVQVHQPVIAQPTVYAAQPHLLAAAQPTVYAAQPTLLAAAQPMMNGFSKHAAAQPNGFSKHATSE